MQFLQWLNEIGISVKRPLEPLYDLFFVRSFFRNSPWEYIRKIGRGSFGTAYIISERNSGRNYLLKRSNFFRRNSQETREGFNAERQLLAELTDPAFPRLAESGHWGKTAYLIMEYKSGKTFEELIFQEGKTFNERESFEIAEKLLIKLAALHEKNIFHRDLRIPNILADGEQIYIIDFGLARKKTQEQMVSENEDPRRPVDYSSDLYGLGHFLLFLLYSGYEPVSLKERPWQQELRLQIESCEIIERLLQAKTPFQDSKEALKAIQSHLKKIGSEV
ncbi:serine/threonine protein kinase [Peribacillus sp. SCS-155]|uniref:serine/threonine protein kinase n=1 Tax=Peribacillus sedimenti TaxID=3115297 RepID=UPI0039061F35